MTTRCACRVHGRFCCHKEHTHTPIIHIRTYLNHIGVSSILWHSLSSLSHRSPLHATHKFNVSIALIATYYTHWVLCVSPTQPEPDSVLYIYSICLDLGSFIRWFMVLWCGCCHVFLFLFLLSFSFSFLSFFFFRVFGSFVSLQPTWRHTLVDHIPYRFYKAYQLTKHT